MLVVDGGLVSDQIREVWTSGCLVGWLFFCVLWIGMNHDDVICYT